MELVAGGADGLPEYTLEVETAAGKLRIYPVAHGTRDQDGQLEYIGAIQDVTQRRRSEEALSQAQLELAHMAGLRALQC